MPALLLLANINAGVAIVKCGEDLSHFSLQTRTEVSMRSTKHI